MNEIVIQVHGNREMSKNSVNVGNMYESGVEQIVFELDDEILAFGGNIYAFVTYDGETHSYPLSDLTLTIGRELTVRRKNEVNIVVSKSDNPKEPLKGVVWISNTLQLMVGKNRINIDSINEEELPPSLKILYDELLEKMNQMADYRSEGNESFATNKSAIALGDYSFASGYNTVAGCKGYYIKSIDTTNKKIYLSNTKVVPVISTEDNTDVSFDTPLYDAGMKFTIINGSHYIMCNSIQQVSNNCITYDGDLPFTEIKEDSRIDAYSFTVPMQPEVGNSLQSSSVSLGEGNSAIGNSSFASGYGNKAFGEAAHVEGYENESKGWSAHAEGALTKANGSQSHAEGYSTVASGNNAHAEGSGTISRGYASHSEGDLSKANGNASHAEGTKTTASGENSHTEGTQTTAEGSNAHAEGYSTEAKGSNSHAEGWGVDAIGETSHAEGRVTKANAENSHAEGSGTVTNGHAAHAEGDSTTSNGGASHAEGILTTASGDACHAEGLSTKAIGGLSHAEGNSVISRGYTSHAEGCETVATGNFQHVQGKSNIEDVSGTYAHIVGNGQSDTYRSNAHTLDWKGNAWYSGTVTSKGADYAEYFEWQDGNPDSEDRVGLLVTLDGEYIRLANEGDEILGVISGTAAILGDNYECEWNGKYVTDDYGRIVYEDVEEFVDVVVGVDKETNEPITEKESLGFFKHPKLNPEYNPEETYINRSERKEWDTVGMLGKLFVRDDGTCQVNGYVTVGRDGIATNSEDKTNMRVLSRVNKDIVRVLVK